MRQFPEVPDVIQEEEDLLITEDSFLRNPDMMQDLSDG